MKSKYEKKILELKEQGESIKNLCVWIYDLWQDCRIDEEEEEYLYSIADPNDEFNSPASAWFYDDNEVPYPNPLMDIKENARPQFKVIYDGDSFIDGIDCDSFEEAQHYAMEVLSGWVDSAYDSTTDDWNYFVNNAGVWVEQWCEDANEYIECWSPSDSLLESIGFVERSE